jgi:hypothetical protein
MGTYGHLSLFLGSIKMDATAFQARMFQSSVVNLSGYTSFKIHGHSGRNSLFMAVVSFGLGWFFL